MRSGWRWVAIGGVPLLLVGCLMSEQAGRVPEEVTFHYVSVFNVFLWLIRVAMAAPVVECS